MEGPMSEFPSYRRPETHLEQLLRVVDSASPHAAAHLHRRHGGRRNSVKAASQAAVSTLVDQVVDPPPFVDVPPLQELRLRAHGVRFGQLVEADLGGDVLLADGAQVVARRARGPDRCAATPATA
jgi:hypothetical protein